MPPKPNPNNIAFGRKVVPKEDKKVAVKSTIASNIPASNNTSDDTNQQTISAKPLNTIKNDDIENLIPSSVQNLSSETKTIVENQIEKILNGSISIKECLDALEKNINKLDNGVSDSDNENIKKLKELMKLVINNKETFENLNLVDYIKNTRNDLLSDLEINTPDTNKPNVSPFDVFNGGGCMSENIVSGRALMMVGTAAAITGAIFIAAATLGTGIPVLVVGVGLLYYGWKRQKPKCGGKRITKNRKQKSKSKRRKSKRTRRK
jgi:hypothetical protein